MELSKREKILLIVLGVLLFLLGYYKFIISFQFESLNAKQEDKAHYENELNRIQTVVALEKEIDEKFEHVNDELYIISKKYFPKTDQSRIILMINELLEGTGLFIQNISFSPQRSEGIGGAQVEIMSVTLPYEGEYSSLLLFLEKIREHNLKTIIQNLDMKIKEEQLLSGTILLDFYSLPNLVEDSSIAYLFDSSEMNSNPFLSFEKDFITDDGHSEYYEEIDLSNVQINLDSSRVLIEGFDNKILDFVPSHSSIKGEISTNENAKQGASSLGLYYSFPPIQDEKHIHIVLDEGQSIVSQPPESIGLWVYSYDITKHSIKLGLKDKKGERQNINLYDEIDWIGWKHLKVDIPQNIFTYPIEVEHIIVGIDSASHGKGTLLFDALEVFYTVEDTPSTIIDDNGGSYRFYDVQVGDTLSSISKIFYGDISKQHIIKKYNDIKSNSDLKPGKTIIIPN